MKVKFIAQADMISQGLHLVPGGIYDVTSEVAEYLEKTFGCIEVVSVEKPLVEPKATEKPKVGTKVVPNK